MRMKYCQRILFQLSLLVFVSCEYRINDYGKILQNQLVIDKDIEVLSGETLEIHPGTEVIIRGEGRIIAAEGANIRITGTRESPIVFQRQGGGYWGGITVTGPGFLEIRHAEFVGAPIVAKDGSRMLIEDTYLHDYFEAAPAIIYTEYAASVNIRRIYVRNYYETHFYATPTVIEDSLFEQMIGDGIDFDNSPEGCIVRNSTVANATNWNVDAIDFGVLFYPTGSPSHGIVENCLIYNVTDKGISAGEGTRSVVVRNTLIHNVGIGISAKDGSNIFAESVTLADNNYGINCYEERKGMGGGNLTGRNMVILGNLIQIQKLNGARVSLGYSGIQSFTASSDPVAVNEYVTDPSIHFVDQELQDYRLKSESALGTLGNAVGNMATGFSGQVGSQSVKSLLSEYFSVPDKIAIYGNSAAGSPIHQKITSELVNSIAPDIVIHTGKMVTTRDDTNEWQKFLDITFGLNKIAPIYPVPSALESDSGSYIDNLKSLPPTSTGWYSIRKDNALFLFLDSEKLGLPEQWTWLESELAASNALDSTVRFRAVSLHKSLYSVSASRSLEELIPEDQKIRLEEIFTREKVRMVFSGQDALYSRVKIGDIYYVNLGGGGGTLEDADPLKTGAPESLYAKSNCFGVLTVDKNTASLGVVDINDQTLDTITVSLDGSM